MKRLVWIGAGVAWHLCLVVSFAGSPRSNLVAEIPWAFTHPADADASFQADFAGSNLEIDHIQINKPSDPFWRILISKTVPDQIIEGHDLHLSFLARSPTHNRIRAVIQHSSSPYSVAAETIVRLSENWQRFDLDGPSPGYPAGGLAVCLQLGYDAGTVEIKALVVEDTGPDPAYVAAEAAIAPDAVARRIEQYRKANLRIILLDGANHPIQGATVTARQLRHSFLFGCNAFLLDPKDHSPLQQAYQERFSALFNYATLPFYWGSYEPMRGHTNDEKIMGMVGWCEERSITIKGHPLVYHMVYPSWASRDADGAVAQLKFRVSDIIERYRGEIGIWDVVNEANSSQWHTDNGVGAWARRDGAATVVATALGWAREAAGSSKETFIYNDFQTGPANVALLEALRQRNSLPDAIGIQSHMHAGEWSLQKVWLNAERFSAFGRPVHFTETTVLSGPHRSSDEAQPSPPASWPSTPEGEAAQAKYLVQFYTILFSHPNVAAITYWDLSDYHAWLAAPAGLLRKDMSPKPAYARLLELIHTTWWTNTSVVTDSNGIATVRGFCGDYSVTAVTADGRQVSTHCSLASGITPTVIELRLR
jgi:GH35 family endo-1,4-beta-xylanase